jgi:hypothetical protein
MRPHAPERFRLREKAEDADAQGNAFYVVKSYHEDRFFETLNPARAAKKRRIRYGNDLCGKCRIVPDNRSNVLDVR